MRDYQEYDEAPQELDPAPYPESDDEDPDEYVEWSRALLEERKEAQIPYRTEWTQNLLFLAGLQWYRYSPISGHFILPNLPPWKERPVWNMLKPFAKTMMAKLTKNKPVTSCIPQSSDPGDVFAAELGDDVLRAKWIELKLAKKLRGGIAWLIATGNAWVMPYWNEQSGILKPITALEEVGKFDAETGELLGTGIMECPCGKDGMPMTDEMGNLDMEAEPAYYDTGEIGVKILSPFQVFPNEGATDEDDIDSLIIVESRPVREIRREYPDAVGIMAEDVQEFDSPEYLMGMSRIAGADTHYAGPHFDRTDSGDRTRSALLLHYYEKPTVDHPQGRYWLTCGKELLEGPGALPDGLWLPLIHMKDIEVPGQLFGEATMTAAVGIQREVNEHAARQKEHFKLMVNGKWAVPIGSGVQRGAITTRPGEVIQYQGNMKPEQIEIRPLPAAVYQEREKLLEAFRIITSMHEVSQGAAPEGVTAGRAFLILQEADDTDLGPVSQGLEEAVAKLSWDMLRLIQQNYDEERLVRISGKHKSYQVRRFTGADLQAIVDVEPVTGSAFPWNKTARQSYVLDMMQTNPMIFIDPATGQFDQHRFRDALPIGGEEAIGHAGDADVAEALREEDAFLGWDGQEESFAFLPTPQVYQDHSIHLRQHGQVLKSADFMEWPPENKEAFLRHYFSTEIALRMQIMQRMELQAAAAPPAAPEGPASKPGSSSGGMPPTQGPQLHRSETSTPTGGKRATGSGGP